MKMLPQPTVKGTMSLEEAIALRRSAREFDGGKLTDNEISQILWSAQGITDKVHGFRAAPSAGATFPLEVYLADSAGVFHYLPREHALELVATGDKRRQLSRAAYDQPWVASASAVVVLAAVVARTGGRYGERALMYVHMEAGHAAQNIHLQAVALGLGSVPVGAFDEAEASGALALPKGHHPLYFVPVGRLVH